MSKQGPGKNNRKGISIVKLTKMFPNDDVAEKWFTTSRWGENLEHIECPKCMSHNIQEKTTHPQMPHRCRSCRKYFVVKTGTLMKRPSLGYQVWAVTIYLLTTNLKGVFH